MSPAEYLKKPYGRNVVPESDGSFRAEIIEFPGCIAVGDTAAEALANLEDVAASWLEATLARNQRVPEPIDEGGFSGKLVVRLSKSLHRRAAHQAYREGVSLNQLLVTCIAEQVGARTTAPAFQAIAQIGTVMANYSTISGNAITQVSGAIASNISGLFINQQMSVNPPAATIELTMITSSAPAESEDARG